MFLLPVVEFPKNTLELPAVLTCTSPTDNCPVNVFTAERRFPTDNLSVTSIRLDLKLLLTVGGPLID